MGWLAASGRFWPRARRGAHRDQRPLDHEPRIAALVEQDLVRRRVKNPRPDRPRLMGDQVIRLAFARQMNTWT